MSGRDAGQRSAAPANPLHFHSVSAFVLPPSKQEVHAHAPSGYTHRPFIGHAAPFISAPNVAGHAAGSCACVATQLGSGGVTCHAVVETPFSLSQRTSVVQSDIGLSPPYSQFVPGFEQGVPSAGIGSRHGGACGPLLGLVVLGGVLPGSVGVPG